MKFVDVFDNTAMSGDDLFDRCYFGLHKKAVLKPGR
jgi:hypothetical protein